MTHAISAPGGECRFWAPVRMGEAPLPIPHPNMFAAFPRRGDAIPASVSQTGLPSSVAQTLSTPRVGGFRPTLTSHQDAR